MKSFESISMYRKCCTDLWEDFHNYLYLFQSMTQRSNLLSTRFFQLCCLCQHNNDWFIKRKTIVLLYLGIKTKQNQISILLFLVEITAARSKLCILSAQLVFLWRLFRLIDCSCSFDSASTLRQKVKWFIEKKEANINVARPFSGILWSIEEQHETIMNIRKPQQTHEKSFLCDKENDFMRYMYLLETGGQCFDLVFVFFFTLVGLCKWIHSRNAFSLIILLMFNVRCFENIYIFMGFIEIC